MSFKFTFPEESLELAKIQHPNMKGWETVCQGEWDIYSRYIGKPKAILDLGCGLGRTAVYINSRLKDPEVEYILADTTERTTDLACPWPRDNIEEWYNDLELTAKFAKTNGLTKFRVLDVQDEDMSGFLVDLVISTLSVGFHYPIEWWWRQLGQVSTKETVYVFTMRSGTYRKEHMSPLVDFCHIENVRSDYQVMVLKGRKDLAE